MNPLAVRLSVRLYIRYAYIQRVNLMITAGKVGGFHFVEVVEATNHRIWSTVAMSLHYLFARP